MPHLAVVLASSPPMRFVGGELATFTLLQYLRARGWTVTVHSLHTPIGYQWDGIRVEPYQPGMPVFGDVLFTHPDVKVDARRLADDYCLPLVYYVHNTLTGVRQGLRDRPADLTLYNAHATARELRADGPVVVPRVTTPDTTGYGQDRDQVGAVNLAASKGGYTVMMVARELRHVPFLLINGGHGIQVNTLREFSNVTLLEQTMPTHMPQVFYARLRLLLMLSTAESYGMVGLEAMRSGVPVIASDLPGIREALGPAGIYVQPGDWQGVRDWVQIMLEEPRLYAEQQARCRVRANQQAHESLSGYQIGHALLDHLAGGV